MEILKLISQTVDILLAEIAAHLEQTHGERFAASTISRFLDRRTQTYKKTRTPTSENARNWPCDDGRGATRSLR